MPSVTFDRQSIQIDGRRWWMLGASMQYARMPVQHWPDRVAAAKQAGFNVIQTSCPWLIHEPSPDRFTFDDAADVRQFMEICHEAGMMVVLKAGPFIGDGYDGGGLPGWLTEIPDLRLRESSEPFLNRVSLYFRKLFNELAEMDVTHGGPIVAVQSEHAWLCSNPDEGERYLAQIARMIRENGIAVPILTANDLWQEVPGTIDTWRGRDDLLVHLRQLRVVQRQTPRIVSEFETASTTYWGQSTTQKRDGDAMMLDLAQVLAACGQAIVCPFHAGTSFGFLAGRLAGKGFITAAPDAQSAAPLTESGQRTDAYASLKRIAMFATQFSAMLGEIDPDAQAPILDVTDIAEGSYSVVSLQGAGGKVVFVFRGSKGNRSRSKSAKPSAAQASIILSNGSRMPVHLGDQSVGWYLFDVDLAGMGRLDYANVFPWALIDRSMLVLYGPPGWTTYLSIAGNPIQASVPDASAAKPFVTRIKSLTIVICNEKQIDAAYHDGKSLYIGADGLTPEGVPIARSASAKVCIVAADGTVTTAAASASGIRAPAKGGPPPSLQDWQRASIDPLISGDSPRFASLEGPATLAACGAAMGYGWYRIQLKSPSGKKMTVNWPQLNDRAAIFLDGKPLRVIGDGPSASRGNFSLSLAAGEHTIVALAQNFGRFADGNDLHRAQGLFGHLMQVKQIRAGKPKKVTARPVDPFKLRGYIAGRAHGQLSDTSQAVWTFTHRRKSPVIVEIAGEISGTIVLNDEPIAYFAGATGAGYEALVLEPDSLSAFKRGKNELRFAPDPGQDRAIESAMKMVTISECASLLTDGASWSFAKWQPPARGEFVNPAGGGAGGAKDHPCWWRATFEPQHDQPLWMDLNSLSKGQVFVNGQNLGRYFSADGRRRKVGPQTRLYIPEPWLRIGEPNELLIFDEYGFDARRVKLRNKE